MIPLEDFLVTHLHKRPHEVEEFDDVGVRCTCVSSCCTKLQHQRKQTTLHNIRPLLKESVLETLWYNFRFPFNRHSIQQYTVVVEEINWSTGILIFLTSTVHMSTVNSYIQKMKKWPALNFTGIFMYCQYFQRYMYMLIKKKFQLLKETVSQDK